MQEGKLPEFGGLEGNKQLLPAKYQGLTMTADDVFVQFEGGGGGLGDPLKREPNVVVKDLYDGYITQTMAEKAYGVVIDQYGRLDEEQTRTRREEIRKERLKYAILPTKRPNFKKEGLQFVRSSGEAFHVKADAKGHFYTCCSDCGTVLSGSNEAWEQSAARIVTKVSDTLCEYGMWVKERETVPYVNLHEFVCPECGSMLTVSTSVNE